MREDVGAIGLSDEGIRLIDVKVSKKKRDTRPSAIDESQSIVPKKEELKASHDSEQLNND